MSFQDTLESKLLKKDLEWLRKNIFSDNIQKEIVQLAKDSKVVKRIEDIISKIPTHHELHLGDARKLMKKMKSKSVHLILTSPPYWTLKEYKPVKGQLGVVEDYNTFFDELYKVWKECYRVLVPGGRLIVVVGDICLSRRKHGRHSVIPFHADIQRQCISIGFENLAPIVWYKITNVTREVSGNGFFGKTI